MSTRSTTGRISSARRRKTPLTFLLVDVDHFRQINSKFGHLTGDVVLADAAALLSIGAAQWRDGATLDETLDAADQNMYAVKNAGREASSTSRNPGSF